MLLVPLDQDPDLLVQLILKREPMDLTESDNTQVLLQSRVIFINLLSCVPLTPSFKKHIPCFLAIFIQNGLQYPCRQLSPNADCLDGLQDGLFLAPRNKPPIYRCGMLCLLMLQPRFLLQWCFVLYNLFLLLTNCLIKCLSNFLHF